MPTVMANLASRTKLFTFFTADSGNDSLFIVFTQREAQRSPRIATGNTPSLISIYQMIKVCPNV